MTTQRHPRGFTILEVMVATALGILVLGLVVGAFMAQQRSLSSIDMKRSSQEATRDALLEMEGSIRRLGFGIDPQYAIDVNQYQCTAPCRDKVNAPDELVFVSRNPNYQWVDIGTGTCTAAGGCFTGNAWPVTGTPSTSLQITAVGGEVFRAGRVLQIVCPNAQAQTMVTVSTKTVAPAGGGTLTLPIQATTTPANPYRENNFTNPCFNQAGAAVFLVDRFRYFVNSTVAADPWLMLDTGLDLDDSGTIGDAGDLIPIAKDVEDLQVAYIMNNGTAAGVAATDSNTDWIVGNAPGVQEQPNPALTAPGYTTPTNDPLRFTLHPANVRAIRVTISVRSERSDRTKLDNFTGDPLKLVENRNTGLASNGQYSRISTSTTISVRDLESRSAFIF